MPYKDYNERKKRRREYAKMHRDNQRKYQRKYAQSHKEEIKKYKRKNKLKKKYGLSITEFDNMLLAQDNKCLICGQSLDLQNTKNVHVDHNHKTGIVRGILCSNCNKALGFFRDNPEYLRNAIKYLERDNNESN